MATKAFMVWTDTGGGVDPARRQLVEQHHGRLDWQPGVAVFAGAAEALRAAVAWQQHEPSGAPTTAIAVTVVELDTEQGSIDAAAAVIATTRELAAQGDPGAILATELVHLLLPSPTCGTWAEEPGAARVGGLPVHQLIWEPTTSLEATTVVVAEDAAIIRAGIVSLLRAEGMSVVGEAADYDAVLTAVRTARPRLLITDVRMPPGQGDEGLRAAEILRAEQPGLSVLVLSQYVQASAAADLLTGQTSGIGYLLKERVTALDEFLEAARTVAAGGTVIDPLITQELLSRNRTVDQLQSLADRERAVLELMAQGLSNAAIAEQLTLSARTVESHVRSIMTKLDLWEDPAGNRRVQAVIRWLHQL
jgi:DNA-binding NarL/FixJ family response regulator